MRREQLEKERSRLGTDLDLRVQENEGFQEKQFYAMEECKKDLIDVLIHLTHKTFHTDILQNLAQNYSRYSTCLLSFSREILQFLPEFQIFTLSHKHYYSHSALLALVLAKEGKGQVKLIASNDSFRGIGHMLADERELDKTSYIQESIAKEGVSLINLEDLQSLDSNTDETIAVVDVFGCSPLDYLPILLKNTSLLKKTKKLFIYHSLFQNTEIKDLVNLLNLNSEDSQLLNFQLWPTHPFNRNIIKDAKQLENSIIQFVRTDAVNAKKMDMIIFYPIKQTLTKFQTKLKQALFKLTLKDHVNIISKKGQSLAKVKNNIFIARSTEQLDEWNYDYSNVITVKDFSEEFFYQFNYSTGCYVEEIGICSLKEKLRRMGRVAVDRIGIYSCLEAKGEADLNYAINTKEVSIFVVKMISYGFEKHLIENNRRISDCLEYLLSLGIVSHAGNSYQVADVRYVALTEKGISPIEAKLFLNVQDDQSLSTDERKCYLNLISMAAAAVKSEGNLRLIRQQFEGSHVKPYAVWRKSGYIESCLQILTKCELIEMRKSSNSKSQQFRRKISNTRTGNQFEPNQKKKIHFEEMEVSDFIKEFTVNEELLYSIRDEVENYRDIFEIEPVPIILSKENINKLLSYLVKSNPRNVCYYSGSKNKDYVLGKTLISISETSLMTILNQRPEFILLTKIENINGKSYIYLSNSISEELYVEQFGHMPINRKNSRDFAKQAFEKQQLQTRIVRQQFQIDNISTAILQEIIQNENIIEQFERQNNCHIYLNLELGKVIIQCFQDDISETETVKKNFKSRETTIFNRCAAITKYIHYMGSISLVLGLGGKIIELIEKGYINKVYLTKLPKEFPIQYLEVVLDGKIQTRNIEIIQGEIFDMYSSAIMEFYSRKDCENFKRYFTSYLQKEKYFECEEFTEQLEREFNKKRGKKADHESLTSQDCISYLQFKWFIWKSHGKAQVHFKNREAAMNAYDGLTNNPELDGSKVKVSHSTSTLAIEIQNLSIYTDEAYLEEALRCYGQIKQVQILKTPLKQTARDSQHIKYLMNKSIPAPFELVQVFIEPIEKKEHGMRICKVRLNSIDQMNIISNALNQNINIMGEGRLHVQTYFEDFIIMPEGSLAIYLELFEETLVGIDNPNVTSQIREVEDFTYLVLKCGIKDSLDIISRKFKEKLRGFNIALPNQAKNIILNEIGITNLLDLQEKYHCKFSMSIITKTLRVLAKKDQTAAIQIQINERLNNHFFYRASISSKHYKAYKEHPEKLSDLQSKFDLRLIQLEEDSRALLMQGNAVQINHLLNSLFERIQKSEGEKQIGENDCHICGQGIEDAYRLLCSHKFCKECLQQLLKFSISDASLFPFKCPDLNCRKQIKIIDLESILEYSDWMRLKNIALNEYLKKHEEYMYCLTAGCEQINKIKTINMNGLNNEHIRCEICKAAFCVMCYGVYHPARTCKQAKMSEDQLLSAYMKNFNVRKCANPKCRVLAERYTGCFKVQCTRCNTCMCFKCPANEMTPYKTPDECYRHLTDTHGGYF